MAYVVEDGTGLANANSYAAVAAADEYFEDRGGKGWTGSDEQKESYLVQATDYIEWRFGQRFIGDKTNVTQALAWPRTEADGYEEDQIPETLKRALYEYANRVRVAPLAPDPVTDAGGAVTKRRTKVGPIETELLFSTGTVQQVLKKYPEADAMLSTLLRPRAGNTVYR